VRGPPRSWPPPFPFFFFSFPFPLFFPSVPRKARRTDDYSALKRFLRSGGIIGIGGGPAISFFFPPYRSDIVPRSHSCGRGKVS